MKQLMVALLIGCLLSATGCVTVDKNGEKITVQEPDKNSQVYKELNSVIGSVKGEYAELDTQRIEDMVSKISSGDKDAIVEVMNHPDSYEPPILMAYAEVVYNAGHPKEAMFWYYTAQLRARSDANKSLDTSTHEGVTQLSERYGAKIGTYALANTDMLESAMKLVMQWDEVSERKYNPKWVAILGSEAKLSSTIRFRDISEYGKINAMTRKNFELGFQNALSQIRKHQAEQQMEED